MSKQTRAGSLTNVSEANSQDMNFIIQASRVYEELGSKKELSSLIFDPPKLLIEQETEVKLHSPTAKTRTCRIYVFDKVFIIASLRVKKQKKNLSTAEGGTSSGFTDGSSSDQQVVWFGDKNTASNEGASTAGSSSTGEDENAVNNGKVQEDDGEYDSDSDSDIENIQQEIFDLQDAAQRKKKRRYNLKMWIDLRKVKPRFKETAGLYGILITYVTKVQEEIAPGEIRFDTSVDQAEVWFENKVVAKSVLGIINEAVNRNAEEVLNNNMFNKKKSLAPEPSKRISATTATTDGSESESRSGGSDVKLKKTNSRSERNSASSASTASTTKKKRRKFVRGKEALRATTAYLSKTDRTVNEHGAPDHDGVLTMKDLNRKYDAFIADKDEGLEAEYTVLFKNPKLGLALSSSKKIGPFVCRLLDNSLAEASGVTLGDRVIAINNTEIPLDMPWQECVKVIKTFSDGGKPISMTFIRKQKTEIDRQKRLEEQQKMNEMIKDEEEAAAAAEEEVQGDGSVLPIEDAMDSPKIVGKKTVDMQTIELRKKTDDGTNIPKFTIKRKKTGKRRFAQKHQVLKNMKYQITNAKDLADFRKNKSKMFDVYKNIDSLFETIIGYTESKAEKTCIFSLKEIYTTEYQYNTELNTLREFYVKLNTTFKNVRCKDLKTGRPFCEHRRPLKLCSQNSSIRQLAIDKKDLDCVFLNLKPIMKSNVYLWKNLQENLNKLYERLEQQIRVEVHDMLEVFCKSFTEIAPFLQIYWEYCKRYTSACEKQKALRANNEHFKMICEPIEESKATKLPKLLTKPVQRITRYHLHFSDLTKYVKKYIKEEESKSNFNKERKAIFATMMGQLDTACNKLVGLAQQVNTKVGEADGLDNMIEAFGEIGGHNGIQNLLAPHRRFVRKLNTKFEFVAHNEFDEDQALLYLFNDMIVVAAVKSKRSPSYFGNGSKLSFPFRKIKNLSVGSTRNTSITKTAKKLSLGSSPSQKAAKRKSVRATRKTPKGANSKGSADSKGSKADLYHEVIAEFKYHKFGKVSKRSKDNEDGTKAFGVDVFASRKGVDEMESFQMIFWFEAVEPRDELAAQLESLKVEDENKRKQLEQMKAELGGGKKKRRRRHEKFDYKKASIQEKSMKDKAKSSVLTSV